MTYRLQALALRVLLAVLRPLPYAVRVEGVGRVVRTLAALVPSLRARAERNLALVYPGWPEAERRRVALAAAANAGRALAMIWFARDARAALSSLRAEGEGLDALRDAQAEGRPAILVTGHFGPFEAMRHALRNEGIEVGGLYRPNNNPHYDPIFVAGLEETGRPVLPRGRAGLRGMIAHLRAGGVFEILADQAMEDGPALPFLGHPAHTSLATAELALRHGAPLLPAFAVEGADGLRVIVEAPIPPSDAATMMAEFNRRLGSRVRADPSQWYWFHRRWKTYG
ncbi:lysophospholipid acyltransferase family protein [Jannaschia sp. W003]|uniref:lysophospholipid acyltransferase family protein n=1 Tax=Jannaschia sp. W003 TaxID=2867012 RepID=UPI0021A62F1B|nr:lysophospholipid acyltransferase family protein [Jannaschia sp. W003]UWQ21775.1 lysophospholipid acyltransferase family protein [Jannaschia sp. W003]